MNDLREEISSSYCYFRSMGEGRANAAFDVIVVIVGDTVARVRCALVGHEWIDLDPGDPEVGPQPDLYCQRCGKSK